MAFFSVLVLGAVALAGGAASYLRHRKSRGRRLYQESLERALADGILTDEETQELQQVREQRDLSEAEVRMVALSLYRRALRAAEADARITAQEDATLQQLRALLGLSDHDLRNDVAQLQRIGMLAEIEREHLPHIDAPVGLANGEQCHWVVQGRLAERLSVPGKPSELRALPFDVDAQQPFSAEGERTDLRSSVEILPSDVGVVVITDRRTLFHGARRTVSVPHMKLAKISLYKDGIRLKEGEGARTYLIVHDPELTAAVLLCAARLRRRAVNGLTTRSA